jgi:hypothetical protein
MRCLLVALSLYLALAVFADGMALPALRETDQVAIIDMQPGCVPLDMYIAIDGIPAGKTVTYVLPFWRKPGGFSLEEMDGASCAPG